jgi:hypothetical protein
MHRRHSLDPFTRYHRHRPAMPATVTIRCIDQSRDVAAVWVGDCLAVHRPLKNGQPIKTPRCWTLTHRPTGLALVSSLTVAKHHAVALAKVWDEAAACIDPAKPRQWRYLQAWRDDLQRVGIVDPWGPRDLPTLNPSTGRFLPDDDETDCEQFPVEITRQTTGAGTVRRNPHTDRLEFWWLPRGGNYSESDAFHLAGWYEVPTFGDVAAWSLDSVAESPCGDAVEPDHPDAWPRLLGIV